MKIKTDLYVPHLQAVFGSKGLGGARGACFYRTAALVIDQPWWTLCIGTLPGATKEEFLLDHGKSPTPFIHCWVEYGDDLCSPSSIENEEYGLFKYSKSNYYAVNKVRDVYRIEGEQVVEMAYDYKWHEFFIDGAPVSGPSIPAVLLEAAEVPHKISERNGIVPVSTELPDYALAILMGNG
jgi:hypothetical protein